MSDPSSHDITTESPMAERVAHQLSWVSTESLVDEITRRRVAAGPPPARTTFDRQLLALARTCCIDGGVVEVRGINLEDSHQYGVPTTEAWPVVYGTLDEPALRPDELRLLTPAAQIVVRCGR